MRTIMVLLVGAVAALTFAPSAVAAGETVGVAAAKVDGASKQVLVNAKGMTLYYFTSDTATSSACTGGCGSIWQALTSDSTPTAASMLPGKVSVVKTANGQQVAYNGHLLYTYSRDQAPGDTNGNGIAGKWFAATADLKAQAVTYCCTTPSSSGSGYSYGNGGGNGGGSGGGNGGMEGGHGGY